MPDGRLAQASNSPSRRTGRPKPNTSTSISASSTAASIVARRPTTSLSAPTSSAAASITASKIRRHADQNAPRKPRGALPGVFICSDKFVCTDGERPSMSSDATLSGAGRALAGTLPARLSFCFGLVQGHVGANECHQRLFVYLVALLEVDSTPCVPVKTAVEEAGRILQSRPLGEGHLHDVLVSLAGADQSVMRPHRDPSPLPLFDDFGIGFLDDGTEPAEHLAPPVA